MLIKNPKYLRDKEFRRLTYDMMLAWEVPGAENDSKSKVSHPFSTMLLVIHIMLVLMSAILVLYVSR